MGSQDIVTAGIVSMLAPFGDRIEVLTPHDGLATFHRQVDVVVYDVLGMLDRDSEELTRLVELSKGVIALGRDLRPDLAARAVQLGAVTTVPMGTDAARLVAAIEAVYAGETADLVPAEEWLAQAEGLSEREAEVLGLITQGLSNPEIAERLYLSINSVKTYIRSAYRKIGATRRSQAVGWAMDHGFTTDKT